MTISFLVESNTKLRVTGAVAFLQNRGAWDPDLPLLVGAKWKVPPA